MNDDPTTARNPIAKPFVVEAPTRLPKLALRELWDYRRAGVALSRRNLKARYRQTLLGVVWVILQPLSLMIVLSIAFGFIARNGYLGVPFPVFFISGLAIWGPAMKIFQEGSVSLIANQQLVTRVYLPRPLVVGSIAMTAFVDLGFTLVALGVVLLLYGYGPDLAYLALPYFVVVAWVFTLGLGLFFGALNVAYRDVQVALPFIERVFFFMSPLIYPIQIVPEHWWPVYYLNPMALVLTGFRWATTGLPPPPAYAFVEGAVVALLTLVVGYVFFRRREPTFTDML